MGRFNADFWEIAAQPGYLENMPAERALWFETQEDRERRHAMAEFFRSVLPAVRDLIEAELTERQKEVLRLYYFRNMTQTDIAETLHLTQSTVSRHLFGTTRNGRRIGGAIPKLQKVVNGVDRGPIADALARLQRRFLSTAS